jgi:hypothetical protein
VVVMVVLLLLALLLLLLQVTAAAATRPAYTPPHVTTTSVVMQQPYVCCWDMCRKLDKALCQTEEVVAPACHGAVMICVQELQRSSKQWYGRPFQTTALHCLHSARCTYLRITLMAAQPTPVHIRFCSACYNTFERMQYVYARWDDSYSGSTWSSDEEALAVGLCTWREWIRSNLTQLAFTNALSCTD